MRRGSMLIILVPLPTTGICTSSSRRTELLPVMWRSRSIQIGQPSRVSALAVALDASMVMPTWALRRTVGNQTATSPGDQPVRNVSASGAPARSIRGWNSHLPSQARECGPSMDPGGRLPEQSRQVFVHRPQRSPHRSLPVQSTARVRSSIQRISASSLPFLAHAGSRRRLVTAPTAASPSVTPMTTPCRSTTLQLANGSATDRHH